MQFGQQRRQRGTGAGQPASVPLGDSLARYPGRRQRHLHGGDRDRVQPEQPHRGGARPTEQVMQCQQRRRVRPVPDSGHHNPEDQRVVGATRLA
jgi:hypothetical protein